MTPRRDTAVFAAWLIVMLAVAVAVQVIRDRTLAYEVVDKEVLYVSDAAIMRRAALSYQTVLADVYWIRALQHYGGEHQKPASERRYHLLYPLLDLATTLDTRFNLAYRFGAIFLAEPRPGGAGRPDLAIALLKKGVAHNPQKWDYYHDIGFNYYWHLQDYAQAADWFMRGGNLPGAPFWLKTYAGVMLVRGGNRQASRAMWTEIGQNAESEWLRKTAELRRLQLDALDQMDELRRTLAAFTAQTGQIARSWKQLEAARAVRGVPIDPTDVPFKLNPETGDIEVSPDSELWPLPTEPKAMPELKREAQPVPR